MRIKVRNRIMIDKFLVIDKEPTVINATRWFITEGTNLFYFRVSEFQYKPVSADEILEISHNGNVIYKQPHGPEKLRHDLRAEILTALNDIKQA